MATETDFHLQNTRPKSVSKLADHGSVSFGRFTPESLAWEKWSVFSHNRHQEELEKFNFPGFVAQRKAYFEEYYNRVRRVNVLQSQEKEPSEPEFYREEVKSQVMAVEGGEKGQVQTSENENSTYQNLGSEGNEEKQAVHTKKGDSLILSVRDSNLSISLPDKIPVSDPAMRVAINSNTRGNVVSSRSMTEKKSQSKKDHNALYEQMKPSRHDKVTMKGANISAALGKSRTREAKNGNDYNHIYSNRKRVQPCSGSTNQRPLITRNMLASNSDGKTSQRKTNSNCVDTMDQFCGQSLERPLKETSSADSQLKSSDNRIRSTGLRNVLERKSYDKETKKFYLKRDEMTRVTTMTSKPITTTSLNNHNKDPKLLQKDKISQPTKQGPSQRVEEINKCFKSTISQQAKLTVSQRVEARSPYRQKLPSWR